MNLISCFRLCLVVNVVLCSFIPHTLATTTHIQRHDSAEPAEVNADVSTNTSTIPSSTPSHAPNALLSLDPSTHPSSRPSLVSSISPSSILSSIQSDVSSGIPSEVPSLSTSSIPSSVPSRKLTLTAGPSDIPSMSPSVCLFSNFNLLSLTNVANSELLLTFNSSLHQVNLSSIFPKWEMQS